MKRFFFLILFSLIALTACNANETVPEDTTTDEPPTDQEEPAETTEPADEPEGTDEGNENTEDETTGEQLADEQASMLEVGETGEYNGVNITINNASVYKGKINEFQPLVEDYALQIDVIVENTTNETVFIDAIEFGLYDEEDFEVDAALPSEDMPLSTELPAGKKAKGKLYFDAVSGNQFFELQYKSLESWEDKYLIWNIPAPTQ